MSTIVSTTSESALITTISEYVETSDTSPPEYNDLLLISSRQNLIQTNLNSDNPPDYNYLFNKPTYYIGSFREIVQKLFTKGFSNCFTIHLSLFKLSFCSKIFFLGKCATILIIILVAVQILNILIGQKYKSECPIQILIPTWLIVHSMSILIVSVNFIMLLKWKLRRNLFIAMISIILVVVWLIKGSFWVYSIFGKIDFSSSVTKKYCNILCYFAAFTNITLIWLVLAFFGLYFILKKLFFYFGINRRQSNLVSSIEGPDHICHL